MTVYYRVIKDTPLWEENAIIANGVRGFRSDEFVGIEDIWDKHPKMTEYLSTNIVEGSPDFFQRVYTDNLEKMIFKTKDQLKAAFDSFKS